MNATFTAYIDESGDEGLSFGSGSSEWFVLSAVITRRSADLDTVRLVDAVRSRLGRPPRKPLHFRDLRHEHRVLYVDTIAKADLRAASVLVHKPSLLGREEFRERYRLYFAAVRHLLERVSWCCRAHRTSADVGDGSVELVFSNRSGMSYTELSGYLAYLRARAGPHEVEIDWRVVREGQILSFTPGRRMGLQIADAVAGSFLYAAEPSQYGFTEDRYARMLKPIMYCHEGQYLGYGVKLWPGEVAHLLRGKAYEWVAEDYG